MDPRVNKTCLDNGIRIVSLAMPSVHSVSMGIWVNVGARYESPEENGLSHLVEHMIFKGTRRRSAFDIAKAFDAIGGHSNAFTAMETTCYHAKVLETHLPTMVDILLDIFLNSVFDETELEKERPVILQEIGMVEDNPDDLIHQLLTQTFWGNDPLGYSILGPRENILRFSADDIRGFFGRLYHPHRMVVAAAGNLEHNALVDLIGATLEKVPVTADEFPVRPIPPARQALEIHRRQIEQQHLCVATPGIAITDQRRFALSLMNTVLGGNMSSRLFQEIRERRGLAYSVYSYMSSFADVGMMCAYAAVHPDKTAETIGLICEGLEGLKQDPVSADELHAAKEFTKGNLLLSSESVDNQMVRLAQNEIHFGRAIPLNQVVEKIEAVTAEDIREVAQTLFSDSGPTLCLLGPFDDQTSIEKRWPGLS